MDNHPHLVQYKIFEPYRKLLAFTTTKQTLNIERVRFSGNSENPAKLAKMLKIPATHLVFPKQTHTNCVAEILAPPQNSIKDTDALITNKPKLCICVQTADCVPILLFDPVENVVSAVHAGWRGTVAQIVEVAVQKMMKNYNSFPENILAAIGPSIGPEIYEVGSEVAEAVRKSIPNVDLTLHKSGSEKYHFNLWEANRQLLLKNGLLAGNIEIFGQCSFGEDEKYFSARREGLETGRMVSGIMLKS